jgi:hypothetical protein
MQAWTAETRTTRSNATTTSASEEELHSFREAETAEYYIEPEITRLTDLRPECWRLDTDMSEWLSDPSFDLRQWPIDLSEVTELLRKYDPEFPKHRHQRRARALYRWGTVSITSAHFHDMRRQEFVGDQVISLISSLINESPCHDCYALFPELMSRLMEGFPVDRYDMARWGNKRYILLPSPEPDHWILKVADRHLRIVYHQDNRHQRKAKLTGPLLAWLERLHASGPWTEEYVLPPRQVGHDCAMGVMAGMIHMAR